MNLQDLRDELTTRAAATDQHQNDLLPGVRHKIRRTKQHRIAATTAAAAVLAAVVAAFLPGTHSATPPADRPPEDYTRDGVTVPGTVGSDKLLKAWIGDRGQDKLSFSWTPTTDSITVHANCDADGGMYAVRFKINGWYVGDAGCLTGPEAWAMGSSVSLRPDSPFWLASPIGRPAQVTADVIDLSTRRVVTPHARISLGIYSTPYDPSAAVDGAPARTVPPAPSDYTKDGVVYRQRIGGDTLAGAQVADPGDTQVHFSFTSTGRPVVLHPFCTANAGSDSEEPPYSVSVRIGPGKPNISTCVGNSTDAGAGDSVTLPAPVPAGQRVDVVAQVVPAKPGGQPVPPDTRFGLGVYFQGEQRTIDGVDLAERIESGGYDYRLTEVRNAPGPSKKLTIDTPAGRPYVLAYGSSSLGVPGEVTGSLWIGKAERTLSIGSNTTGALGLSTYPRPAGEAGRATLTVSNGTPTKGTLIVALYEPVS